MNNTPQSGTNASNSQNKESAKRELIRQANQFGTPAYYKNIQYSLWLVDLPPLALRIYWFLLARAKPKTIQEFDKQDFDEFCLQIDSKIYTPSYFNKSVKLLDEREYIKIRRRYKGGGHQVQAFFSDNINSAKAWGAK